MAGFLRNNHSLLGLHNRLVRPNLLKPSHFPHTPTRLATTGKTSGNDVYSQTINRNPNSSKVVVGSAIIACTAVWLYAEVAKRDYMKLNENGRPRKDRTKMDFLLKNFVVSRRNIESGRWWTLVTHTFTHFEWWHLGLNMMALWSIGRPLVMFYGVKTFSMIWILAGAGGGAVQVYWSAIMDQAVKKKIVSKPFGPRDGDRPAVGASGSICGMLGLMGCAFPSIAMQPLVYTASISLLCLLQGWLPFVGHIDHLSGIALGAAWSLTILRKRRGW